MKRKSFGDYQCSLAQALERVGDWWVPLILRDIYLGVNRFDDLIENLGMSRNLLSTRLKELVANGLIEKQNPQVKRSAYVLSAAGLDLIPILAAMTAWGDKWAPRSEGPPVQFFHDTCGHQFVPTVICPECGDFADAKCMTVVPGLGARRGPGTWVLATALGRGK